MNRKIRNIVVLLIAVVLTFQTACNKAESLSGNVTPDSSTSTTAASTKNIIVEPYTDIRALQMRTDQKSSFEEGEYNPADMITFTFNGGTVLKGSETLKDEIMNNGKNPGLGIQKLHQEGITGKGINVAIIDQNLLLHHPEFDGKITKYYDTGCKTEENTGSMHAPAVTSILVGNSIGVAPDAKVYFAAAPSWEGDSEFYAKGLDWIIEENKKLPEGEKIRVVSVSTSPSGEGSPFTKNQEMWDEAVLAAQKEGILILDCCSNEKTGIIAPAFYDPKNPDDISMCTGGFPTSPYKIPTSQIGVPTSYRTVAEEYLEGSPSYQYTGQGGLSWGIPYAAGVLALGWQVNPSLDMDQLVQILFDTCSTANDGSNMINPTAFISAVKKTVR